MSPVVLACADETVGSVHFVDEAATPEEIDVRYGVDTLAERLQGVWAQRVVVVEKGDELTARGRGAVVAGGADAAVSLVADDAATGRFIGEQELIGVIGGPVVHD